METIIVFNIGSSSLKLSLFELPSLNKAFCGVVENCFESPQVIIRDHNKKLILSEKISEKNNLDSILEFLLNWVDSCKPNLNVVAIGHRVVHGANIFFTPIKINPVVLDGIKSLIPLAPMHQAMSVQIIEALFKLDKNFEQVACFDTAFHCTQSDEAKLFALPLEFAEQGVIRYGFHGLSYEYIASEIGQYSLKARDKVIVAHLGNGSSACAMNDLKSVSSTMSFSVLDGLIMGTRCGSLDPGVLLYLLQEKNMSVQELSDLLYKKSGLKGVSGLSHDMRELISSNLPEAKTAIELYCNQAAKELAGLVTVLGGLDLIVFTAGVGEKQPYIREKICSKLSHLGLEISKDANCLNKPKISTESSTIEVLVMATDEEKVIARHTAKELGLER